MSDIKQINGKYYDFDCKNESFLTTAKELKTLGIKNYYFMLRIDNPRVADIDPFKPNITAQEIQLLMQEFKNNMWSFARMAVRMRTDFGIVPLGLHRGLAAAYWCYERSQDFCLCEPRQTWKTTGLLAGPIQWTFQLSQNMTAHFFGKETENTKKNLSDLKNDIELLPEWMQFKRYTDSEGKTKKARQSTETLQNNLLHNQVIIHPKPSSLSHAQGLGRGGSGALLYFDEIEHTPFFGEILSNSAPLYKTASENASKAGLPHCRCMTCTPGNLDTREGKEALPIIQSMIPWTEKIYDMTDEEIAEYKSAFSEEYHNSEQQHTREVIDVFYMEYQYYQVRKTYKWVQEQYKLSGDKMAIRREILMQRLRGSTESPIDPEDIEYLISNMKKSDNDLIINGKWRFRLYPHGQGMSYGKLKLFDENIPYLIGIDPSGGGGGDNFAVTIVNPYNLQIAAEFKSPYLTLSEALKMFVTLIKEYMPRGVLIPEKNSMGCFLIQALIDQTSIKDRIYWSESARQLEEMVEETDADHELKSLAVKYKKYGTFVSTKVRKAMMELLFQHIAHCKQLINTEYLVDDICKLVRTSTGRIEAMKGEHDDSLFSYLHVLYIYYTGDNLAHFGIYKKDHPIIGVVEEDLEETLEEENNIGGFFSTDQVTFDDEVMQSTAMMEEQIHELVNRFDFIHDEIYSKDSNKKNPYDNTINISPYFFDTIN